MMPVTYTTAASLPLTAACNAESASTVLGATLPPPVVLVTPEPATDAHPTSGLGAGGVVHPPDDPALVDELELVLVLDALVLARLVLDPLVLVLPVRELALAVVVVEDVLPPLEDPLPLVSCELVLRLVPLAREALAIATVVADTLLVSVPDPPIAPPPPDPQATVKVNVKRGARPDARQRN
jgi:hypothetical protein